jgi:hypothetical protein
MRSESELDGKKMMIFQWRPGLIFIHNAKCYETEKYVVKTIVTR